MMWKNCGIRGECVSTRARTAALTSYSTRRLMQSYAAYVFPAAAFAAQHSTSVFCKEWPNTVCCAGWITCQRYPAAAI